MSCNNCRYLAGLDGNWCGYWMNAIVCPSKHVCGRWKAANRQMNMELQFRHFKRKYPDCILFFRMGDFYETFHEDAEICARVLELPLGNCGRDDQNRIPTVHVPDRIDYLTRMLQAGHSAVVYDEVSGYVYRPEEGDQNHET